MPDDEQTPLDDVLAQANQAMSEGSLATLSVAMGEVAQLAALSVRRALQMLTFPIEGFPDLGMPYTVIVTNLAFQNGWATAARARGLARDEA